MKRITLLLAMVMMYTFASAQSVDEIIKKHIEKTGGEKAWEAIKSIKAKGSATMMGQQAELTNILTNEGKKYIAVRANGMDIVQIAYNGEYAWGMDMQSFQNKKKNEDETKNVVRAKNDFPSPYLNFKKKGYKAELVGNEKINNEDCFKLKITKGKKFENGKEIANVSFSFISKKSYFELATEESMNHPQYGEITTKITNSDFKEVNGLMLPHKLLINQMGQESSLIITKIEINGAINNSIFDMK